MIYTTWKKRFFFRKIWKAFLRWLSNHGNAMALNLQKVARKHEDI